MIEKIWIHLAQLAALALLVFFIVLCFATKRVDGYYMTAGGNVPSSACVAAHWTWHTDYTVFCSDDYNKALDFYQKANAGVK